jgi:hypothetical protein
MFLRNIGSHTDYTALYLRIWKYIQPQAQHKGGVLHLKRNLCMFLDYNVIMKMFLSIAKRLTKINVNYA